MKIKKIEISNFKSIRDLSIDVSSGLNLIIGKNNSGKTTILEALLLWKKCYDNSITVNKYKFYSKPKYVNFSDLNFIRITDDSDLFNSTKGKKAECRINVVLEIDGDDCSLGFTISKVSNVHNAYYQLSYFNPDEFVKFEHFAKKIQTNLSSIIAMSESKPISNIIPQEPYMYKAQIKSKIKKGKSYEVLRNKIVNFDVDTSKIQMYISNVLGENYEFIEKEKENKEYIKLLVSSNGKQADILSQGSGFLQVAEIFFLSRIHECSTSCSAYR
jgi:AAA15 family ATPase/GTPase